MNSKLPAVFTDRELLEFTHSFPEDEANRIKRRKVQLEIESDHPHAGIRLYRKTKTKVTPFDICGALVRDRGYFLSHHSAMYLNGLFNQKPTNFVLTKEVGSKLRPINPDLNEHKIQRAFLKPGRKTSKFFTYLHHKFTLIEKIDYEEVGVISKKFNFSNLESSLELLFSDLERTFLDSIISPQYSGGILSVIRSFDEVEVNIDKLFEYYKKIDPIYPYWQSLGLILDKKDSTMGDYWQSLFKNKKKMQFYIDRPINIKWAESVKWNVKYPKGVFDEN